MSRGPETDMMCWRQFNKKYVSANAFPSHFSHFQEDVDYFDRSCQFLGSSS